MGLMKELMVFDLYVRENLKKEPDYTLYFIRNYNVFCLMAEGISFGIIKQQNHFYYALGKYFKRHGYFGQQQSRLQNYEILYDFSAAHGFD